jgi:hypothetical protein
VALATPTTVLRTPEGVIFRMVLFCLSATKTLSDPSTATPASLGFRELKIRLSVLGKPKPAERDCRDFGTP